MGFQSLVHHQLVLPVSSGCTSPRQGVLEEDASVRHRAKSFSVGFASAFAGEEKLVHSLRVSSGAVQRFGFSSSSPLGSRRSSMDGGLLPLPATGPPIQSKLADGDGIVIVDHGSRRAQSNAMLHEFVKMYKEKTGRVIVEAAHMELAPPTIADAFDRCVEQGATRVIISPYFFFPGRHWDKDIPLLAAGAAKKHANVPYLVTAPIGLHELMVHVINDRMEYCLSQVAGEVSECDMCSGSGRCKQLNSQDSLAGSDSLASSGRG